MTSRREFIAGTVATAAMPRLQSYQSQEQPSGPVIRESYWRAAYVYHVVDGDTIDAEVDLGHRQRADQRLRLLRINTPELHASDPAVRQKAQAAKQFVVDWLEQHGAHNTLTLTWGGAEVPVWNIRSQHGDSFDRWLSEVECQLNHNLSDDLLAAGLAVPFK